jgi:hypothetical protein
LITDRNGKSIDAANWIYVLGGNGIFIFEVDSCTSFTDKTREGTANDAYIRLSGEDI